MLTRVLRSESFHKALILAILIPAILLGFINKKRQDDALKKYTLVEAIVTDVVPARSDTRIYVEYSYDSVVIKNDLTVRNEPLDLGEHIILKVSKSYPTKYVEFVRRLNVSK